MPLFFTMDLLFDKYADAVLFSGLKIREGDVLSINTEEEESEFAKLLATKAKAVTGNGSYIQRLERGRIVENFDYLSSSPLSLAPTCFVYIPLFKEYPEIKGEKEFDAPLLQSFRLLSDPLDNPRPSLPFVTCPLPSPAWDKALEDFGTPSSSLLYNILSLEEDSFLNSLKNREDAINYEKDYLNKKNIIKCRIADDEGSDLEFSFLKDSLFHTSSLTTTEGRAFCPTITSFDIFRLLDPTSLTGWLNISKPIVLWGKTIRNLSICFKGGKIVEYSSTPQSEALMDLYLSQDPLAGRASMVTITELSSPLFDEDLTHITEYDRMRTISITVGGPKGEAVDEGEESNTIDCLLSLSLPFGRDSSVITALDDTGNEYTIYSGGWFIEDDEEEEYD